MDKHTKTAVSLFIDMPNSKLPTNFQLNIFIFETGASLQTLLESLKQKDRKSAKVGNVPKRINITCLRRVVVMVLFHINHL